MTTETVEKVRRFVARETEVPFEEVLPGTRLYSDLNLDGPRAVVFMEHFSARFQVDIEDLWVRWAEYFSTEGVTLKGFLVLAIAAIALVVITFFALPMLSWWLKVVIDLALLSGLAILFLRGSNLNHQRKEITVGDLVNAIKEERLRLR